MTQQSPTALASRHHPSAPAPSADGAYQLPLAEDVIPLHERTVPKILARSVARFPDRPALVEPRGRTVTYRELDQEARSVAAALRGLGIDAGENVVAMLDPHLDNVVGWLGANIASIVWVPLNTSYKGSVLQQVIEHSDARTLIIEQEWLERIRPIVADLPRLRTVIVHGTADVAVDPLADLRILFFDELRRAEPVPVPVPVPMPEPEPEPEPTVADLSTIMYTSGTEGRPKGVMIPHGCVYAASISHERTAEVEIVLTGLPFFHVGGLFTGVFQAIRTGGTAILHGTFSGRRFLEDARTYRCTTTLIVGPIAMFLLDQPSSPQDRDHSLNSVVMFPVVARAPEFSERFGVPVAAGYGCTEIAAALLSRMGEGRPGLCGEPLPHYEVELLDEFDSPVAPGETGELVIRPREPYMMSRGYFKAPELTAAAWSNLWFHTGDLLRLDADTGQYVFVDRRKDVLRRRGENIASAEVERHLLALPQVQEAAVVAEPSAVGEDEIRAVLVAVPGVDIDHAELLRSLYDQLPYFMVPRYIEVVDQLPRTATMKVQKAALRAQGMSESAWDCEAAGFRITRRELLGPS